MVHLSRRNALAAAMAGAAAANLTTASAQPRANLGGYAVNLDCWFRDVPFEQRFALARQAGFKIIEFWRARRAPGLDASVIRKLADDNGLAIEQFAPEAPWFSDPTRHGELVKMIETTIADARTLGCTQFTLVGHHIVEGMTREAMIAGYTTGLMRIAPMLEAAGITALVEPFNTVNHLGHLLNGSQPAYAMVKSVNSPRIKLLWDFYHMQLEDGDLIQKFKAGFDQVAYIQIGDVPGRHEPGTGEINHANLIHAIRAGGYKGKIGLEFMPLLDNWRSALKAVAGLDTGG
ncbi:hydroxypyruvate isomerase [Rhizomicrobium sp. SCGC AG-212-E05]|nr:hydroxypyruvate isomerase [Rhizomicrobium sp. SCGC AG-212-E05]